MRFVEEREGSIHFRVHEQWASALLAALRHGQGCTPAALGGRGVLQRVRLDDGRCALIRSYRRGGAAGRLVHNAYLLDNRPVREFQMLAELYQGGFPVPEPLAVMWWQMGLWYGGAIATRELAGECLLDALRRPGADDAGLMRRAGALIRQFHDAGIWHADLQVRNVLSAERGLVLLDFDNARRQDMGRVARARNLLRFRRSLLKNGLPASLFLAFLEGYGPLHIPRWLDVLYRLRGFGRS